MKPSQKLELRQGQSLVMTAQLQQSIKLLQLSSLELNEFVAQEMESNPLLTREREDGDGASEDASSPDQPDGPRREEASDSDNQHSEMMDSNYGTGWQDDEARDRGPSTSAGSHDRAPARSSYDGGSGPDLEQTLSSDVTLQDHLLEQLQVDIGDTKMRMLARQLMDMIDDSGFLREDVRDLAEMFGASEELVEGTLEKLKQFDPPGIFARDLQECFRIQLAERNQLDPLMETFIDNIYLMEKGDITGLQKTCGASDEDFQDMLNDVRMLDPYPARKFINDLAQPVIPDVFVRGGKEGKWIVELNHDVLPKVLLDQQYYHELDTRARDKESKKYLSEQLGQASWLVKALDQRAQTVMKVSAEIVNQQEQFLLYGIQFLKPLTLKDIALAVDMHESTISRVTTNKFMATPRGIFELKYFFTSSVASSSGADDVSSKTVMYYIKELIEAESPKAVLSDDAIVKELKHKNVDVARRTVAKYREAMHIPSSVVRRRQKKQSI